VGDAERKNSVEKLIESVHDLMKTPGKFSWGFPHLVEHRFLRDSYLFCLIFIVVFLFSRFFLLSSSEFSVGYFWIFKFFCRGVFLEVLVPRKLPNPSSRKIWIRLI
jgi:hypothetical protein